MPLLIAFILVPLIEIALFIQVGGAIGLWSTLAIVVLTAIAGAYLVRQQGLGVLREVQSSFDELRDPSGPLAEGAMILFSGALLLTPGFFTDAVGFALLVPAIRKWLFRHIRARITIVSARRRDPHQPPRPSDDIVEGEYVVRDDTAPSPNRSSDGSSGWTRH